MLLLTKLLLPSQQMDEDVDGCVCDCGSNVATIGVVVTLMIDPTSSGGVAALVQLLMVLLLLVPPLLLLLLLMLMLFLSDSTSGDHVVSHVALHVQSVVGMTGA